MFVEKMYLSQMERIAPDGWSLVSHGQNFTQIGLCVGPALLQRELTCSSRGFEICGIERSALQYHLRNEKNIFLLFSYPLNTLAVNFLAGSGWFIIRYETV